MKARLHHGQEDAAMTEQKWLECTSLEPMLEILKQSTKHRRFRLLACACCRLVWDYLVDERSRRVIELTEDYLENRVDEHTFRVGSNAARDACAQLEFDVDDRKYVGTNVDKLHVAIAFAAWDASNADNFVYANSVVLTVEEVLGVKVKGHEGLVLANLLRDIFGNPFRPVSINLEWLTWNDGTVRRVAQSIYEEKTFNQMPILADALEDAGCDNEDILNHCRSGGEHVRACWVVDALLGKNDRAA
jgi:hypothetical protein